MVRDGKSISLKRLVRFGNSFAFVLPSEYVKYTCSQDKNGKLWVEVNYSSEDSIFTIKGFQFEEGMH